VPTRPPRRSEPPRPSPDSAWASLPESITRKTLRQLDPSLQGGLERLARHAGIQFRLSADGPVRVKAGGSHPPFFRLISLQDAAGQFLPDARDRLGQDGDVMGFGDAIAGHVKVQGLETTQWGAHEVDVVAEPDTISALRRVQESTQGSLKFFRIKTTDQLLGRFFLWNILTELARGVPAGQVVSAVRRLNDRRKVSGIVEMAPASFMGYPLIARAQPLAAVFMTAHGSQVVALARRGAFIRRLEFGMWPVGLTRIRFNGPGLGIYNTKVEGFPEGHAELLLRLIAERADAAIHHLTAPERYCNAQGVLDTDSYWLTWSSVLFGMDAMTCLAAEWDQASAIWTAFRALGVLQGIWQGDRPKAPPLSALLDPRHIQRYAVATFPEGAERDWAGGVIENYERDLKHRFPSPSFDETLKEVAEVRNLVHGVHATGDRMRRLKVLHRIDEHAPNLQLINEVAAYWWLSVLLNPLRNAVPGLAPWEVTG